MKNIYIYDSNLNFRRIHEIFIYFKLTKVTLYLILCTLVLTSCSTNRDDRGMPILSLSYNNDGTLLAIAGGGGLSWQNSAPLYLLNQKQPSSRPTPIGMQRGPEDSIFAVTFNSKSQVFASGGQDKTVRLWNAQQLIQGPVVVGSQPSWVYSLAFNPQGTYLASGGSSENTNNNLLIWDITHQQSAPIILKGQIGTIYSLDFSPDGLFLASGDSNRNVYLWNIEHLDSPPIILAGASDIVISTKFSYDGRLLAVGSRDHRVRIWDTQKFDDVPIQLSIPDCTIESLAFSLDSQIIAVACSEAYVQLWQLSQPDKPYTTITIGERTSIKSVAFSPNGQTLAGGTLSGKLYLWEIHKPSATPTTLFVP